MGKLNNWGYGAQSGGGGSTPLTFPDIGSVNALSINTGAATLSLGFVFTVTGIIASNTGATTITINGSAPAAIVGMNNLPLQGGELSATFDVELLLNSAGTVTLLGTSNGSLPVKTATETNQAINLNQLNNAVSDAIELTLQIDNNLSEIAAEGSTAQLAARTNLGIPLPTTFLQVPNNLSEIAAEGSTAQAAARVNLGIDTSNFLQVPNNLSEIAAEGTTAQTTARTNINAQQNGVSLLTANNLHEIDLAGSTAQAAARTNINAEEAGVSLLIGNNLSEIAANGPLAQAAAQSNLGISGGGGGSSSGNLLGTMLIVTSGTYTLATGTNTIYAEIVGGGGGAGGIPATSATQMSATVGGMPGAWGLIQIPKSQLSTAATNRIIITIGGGGNGGTSSPLGAGAPGGNTIIDTNVAIATGGVSAPAGSIAASAATSLILPMPAPTNSVTVLSPSMLIKERVSLDFYAINPPHGIINGVLVPSFAAYNLTSFSFFGERTSATTYGAGGNPGSNTSSSPSFQGSPGYIGAVRLWMYS